MIRKLVPCLLWVAMLPACGNGDVAVTIQTALPAQTRNFNLARTLTLPGQGSNLLVQNLTGPTCRQADLRAGFRAQGGETRWFPVELDMAILDYDTTALANNSGESTGRPSNTNGNITTLITATAGMTGYLLNQSALNRPITIPVPKGIPGELFVMGSLYEPVNQDHTGGTVNTPGTQCLRARNDQKPLKSFAVYGSRPFLANEAGSASLAVNVLQHTKPVAVSALPTPYSTPNPTIPIANNSDLKCRDVLNPRTCANRGLYQIVVYSEIGPQILIRQPPPTHPQNFFTRINLEIGFNQNGISLLYIPKESPFLLSYKQGSTTLDVLVQFSLKQLSYVYAGTRQTQELKACTATNGIPIYAGNLPTQTSPNPTPPPPGTGCVYNFAIQEFDTGFN